jgi:hypothetical protein
VSLHVQEEFRRVNPVFLGKAPARDYVAGLECMTELGVGWNRRLITPLRMHGTELSDLLLYDPSDTGEPGSLEEVVPFMLGSTHLQRGQDLGVYWETYGAPVGTTLEFDLTLERDPGRVVDRLRALFSGGSQEGRGRVQWAEPAESGVHSRGLTLELSDLGSGDYTLVLSVRWPGQPPVERRRVITVE